MTATEFRKSLFPLLDRAIRGENVEITYKGSTVKLIPGESSSKLSRAKRQHGLLCDPDLIVHGDGKLLAEMESQWLKDWKKL